VRLLLSTLLTLGLFGQATAQKDTSVVKADTLLEKHFYLHEVERNGITLPEINIKEVLIVGSPRSEKKLPYWKYDRLIYNLKKVYPYAVIVKSRLAEINAGLEKIKDDHARKKYLRQTERELFGEYEDDVKDMTITQGRLLLKLIDRETANTSYDLIRQYRGSFSAAFWQSIARIFGTNLKEGYDPEGEDLLIESLMHEIENGNL
jgi:hypothetical protein